MAGDNTAGQSQRGQAFWTWMESDRGWLLLSLVPVAAIVGYLILMSIATAGIRHS